jgi:hypothetical protein
MKAENIYRILLRAYPSRYRREYAEAMVQCFRDQLREANTAGKLIALWLRTIGDLALTVPVQYWERAGRLREYSPAARHAIFYAHYEAASFNGREVTLEHLLRGVLREEKKLAAGQTDRPRRRVIATGGFPMSLDCKKALAEAHQLAQDAGSKIMPRHILVAILKQDSSEAARLRQIF